MVTRKSTRPKRKTAVSSTSNLQNVSKNVQAAQKSPGRKKAVAKTVPAVKASIIQARKNRRLTITRTTVQTDLTDPEKIKAIDETAKRVGDMMEECDKEAAEMDSISSDSTDSSSENQVQMFLKIF